MLPEKSSWKRPQSFPTPLVDFLTITLTAAMGVGRSAERRNRYSLLLGAPVGIRLGEQSCGQAPSKAGSRKPAVVGGSNRGAHRLHLLLHEPVDVLQCLVVDRPADDGLGSG